MLGISVFPDVNARRLCGIFDEFAVFFSEESNIQPLAPGLFFHEEGVNYRKRNEGQTLRLF